MIFSLLPQFCRNNSIFRSYSIFLPSYVMTRLYSFVLFVPALPAGSVSTTGGPSISISTMLRCSSRAQHGAMRSPSCINSDGLKHKRICEGESWALENREWSQVTCLWQHTTTTGTDCRTVGCILLMVSFYMSQLQKVSILRLDLSSTVFTPRKSGKPENVLELQLDCNVIAFRYLLYTLN